MDKTAKDPRADGHRLSLDQLVSVLSGELDRIEEGAPKVAPPDPLWRVELADPSTPVRAVRLHVSAPDPHSALAAALDAIGPWMRSRRALSVTLVPLEELPER